MLPRACAARPGSARVASARGQRAQASFPGECMNLSDGLRVRRTRSAFLPLAGVRWLQAASRAARRLIDALLPWGLWDFLLQMAVLSSCYWLYTYTRAAVHGEKAEALHNAALVMRLEQALGIFHEAWLQAQVSRSVILLRGLDWFWSNVHLPVVIGCLLWVYLARHRAYPFVRNWFLTLNLLGIAIYALLPTAPPRLLPSSGIVDTAWLLSAHSLQWGIRSAMDNPYAAMPSLHMAYALFVACTVVSLARGRAVKLLAGLYPIAIGVAIIATGNHWFLERPGRGTGHPRRLPELPARLSVAPAIAPGRGRAPWNG